MKLYYKPGACSLASHIALREAGADFDLEKVDTAAGVTKTGADFRAISAMGYVPALTLFRGGLVCLNSFEPFLKWIFCSVMPPSRLALA